MDELGVMTGRGAGGGVAERGGGWEHTPEGNGFSGRRAGNRVWLGAEGKGSDQGARRVRERGTRCEGLEVEVLR